MTDENSARDPYAVVLADLRVRREEIDKLIQGLESLRGGGSFSTESAPSGDAPVAKPTADAAGLFLGMSIAEASKRLLASKRRTLSSAELANGLRDGGLAMNSSDPANTISSVLIRRFTSIGDIVRVSRGQWGLAEWYPNRSFKKKPTSRATEPDVPDLEETMKDTGRTDGHTQTAESQH